MDTIVKETAKIIHPFILIFGFYVALHGHITPGGGFAAGAIIGSAFALLVLSFNERDVEHDLTRHELIGIKSFAGLFMLLIVLEGSHMLRGYLMGTQAAFSLWSGGFTIIMNAMGTMMVASAIILIIYIIDTESWKR